MLIILLILNIKAKIKRINDDFIKIIIIIMV
jgi:hypothetical protein